jgi:predicted HD superfamily hydrolase involved in NAD metabolism
VIVDGRTFVRDARAVRAHLAQEHRFAHTLRVARTAERLAAAHGVNSLQARAAGLFHDLARLYPADRLLRECGERRMPIDTFELANPIVLHARLGAELARDDFGVTDEAILSAIRKHTVAAATMSPLDAILYLADGLEPGRDFAERAGLLELAFRDLDAALLATLENGALYLRSRNQAVAPQTLAAISTYRSREKCPV